jgi:predicted transcriptional regulator
MSTKKSSKSKLVDKSENKEYVDLLDEDKPMSGQKYVCLSFISPEDHIKNKNLFYFEKFLTNFEFKKTFEKYTQFLNFLSYKYNLDFNKLTKDMEEFVEEEKEKLFLTSIDDEYKSFLDSKEEDLQKEYNKLHTFQTNTRGIKVRGVFGSQEEAEMRCKILRDADPNHDVYVGGVGIWMPFHPEAYKTGRVEYLEKDLNDLMAQKKKNDEISKEQFKERVKESKKKAIQENIAKAQKEGNKLMQTIDEEGNLVNADRMDIPGKNLLFGDGDEDDVSTADLRKELFEAEDVIVGKQENNDHGLSQILERQKELSEQLAAQLAEKE